MTARIYFDITDLVDFFKNNHHVTGIQRVQLKILAALALQVPDQIACVAHEPESNRFLTYDPAALFLSTHAPSGAVIQGLARGTGRRPLLDKASVRSALQQYNHRKLYRGVKKAELYLSKLLAPQRLAQLGYTETIRSSGPRPVPQVFKGPQAGDIYVVLGHNWSTTATQELARHFRANQGHAVQVIHDLIAATAPHYFPSRTSGQFRQFLDNCAKNFDRFICISDNTRQDLLRYYRDKVAAQAITTLRLAHTFDDTLRNAPAAEPNSPALATLKPGTFVPCVGTIEPRKNGHLLLIVWEMLYKELGTDTPTLVFAGKLGWKTETFMQTFGEMQRKGIPVVVITNANDKDLHYLYANCLFSVYPSLYEGWGLPVGESAWLGRTCVASNASSIPEVCGDLLDYFDPKDPADMLKHIRHACTDRTYRTNQENRLRLAPLRTWSDVAADLFNLLDGLDGSSRRNAMNSGLGPRQN